VPTHAPVHCPHRPPCPGCPRFNERGLPLAAFAELRGLAEAHGLPAPRVTEGPRFGFRHRARLAVRGRVENPKIGIFELATHRVVHIPDCRVHHPRVNEVAGVVRRALVEQRIPPYSDQAHAGRVRYLQIVVERENESAQLVIVTRDEEPTGLEGLFDAIATRLGPKLHSAFWNGQPERDNAILGSRWRRMSGPEAVVEQVGGVRLHYPPGAFGQSNLPLADRLSARVADFVPEGARVAEFYAGVGAIGLPLATRATKLALNELNADSLAGLEAGIAELPDVLRAKIGVHPGSAGSQASLVGDHDLVIVDPPRRGLDVELLNRLIETPPARLIYVSCGLPSLLREAELLCASGLWKLSALEAFALFPHSEHVETLAVFDS
jgi:tRNA/tmRNA/rRNA uracil-C5-methylase (TrmA/RlmC/RlmD family)